MLFFKDKQYKYRNFMYAVIPSADTRLDDLGLSMCVLFEDEFHVSGLRFLVGEVVNFKYHIDDFEKLLKTGKIECIVDEETKSGKFPKYIITTFKEIYEKNLQK